MMSSEISELDKDNLLRLGLYQANIGKGIDFGVLNSNS